MRLCTPPDLGFQSLPYAPNPLFKHAILLAESGATCCAQVSAKKGEAAALIAWESAGLKLEAFLPAVCT